MPLYLKVKDWEEGREKENLREEEEEEEKEEEDFVEEELEEEEEFEEALPLLQQPWTQH